MNKTFLLLPLSTLSISPLFAQELSVNDDLEDDITIEKVEVVGKRSPFGATKTNTPIVELARTISIETASDLKQKGALNLFQSAADMAGGSASFVVNKVNASLTYSF
ncbi:hypothetical protein [Alteromonas gracilis]|uniref:hypothetical protein n=1 Tax=Alteromonas gracilis TaxID=1479524 RepID=UPI002FDF962F